MGDFAKYLQTGESVRRVGRVSAKSLASDGAFLALLVTGYWLAAQALFAWTAGSPLASTIEPFTRLVMGVLTAFLALVALATFVRIWLKASLTRYALTESRVLVRSFLRVRGAAFSHVQDVEVVQGLLGKMLGFGDVLVHTASTEGVLRLRAVDSPHDWFRLVHESVRQQQIAYGRAAG